MNLWPWWLAAAFVLVIAEAFSGDLVLIMIAVGSLAAAAAAALGAPVAVQAIIGGVVALSLLAFVRPLALRTLRPESETVTNTPRLVGRAALVIEPVGEFDGRVRLDGEVWSARTDDGAVTFAPGEQVRVRRIDGATAIVEPLPTHDPTEG